MCCNIISVVTDIASKNKPISLLSNRTNIKMGRRIQKSKRHKKIKSVDPFQKGKEFRHQNQHTNHEPSDEDIQEVPRRLQELIKMKTLAKENKLRNKKKKFKKHDRITVTSDVVVGDVQGMKRPLKEVPYKIQQEEYESEFQFIQRLHHATERAIAEVRMEEKYGINKEEQDLAIVNSQTKENGESSKRKRNFHEKKRLKKKMKREEKIDDFGYLKGWYRGEKKAMKFAIPRIWHEPADHSSNCYFCMVDCSKNASAIMYLDLLSSIAPLP
ncbi:uncharacterized protein LOC143225157 isoform X2 [Tachypleus tridentatus]|uniref:uncharacterized protein LOC143225157 isoform X2 n=1 Tax=Tachypleus tridentatus TaxID=6853 RepID=UPI003FCFE033